MKIGYARVSTAGQNLDSQIAELQKLGCEKIFVEKVSGDKAKRPVLEELYQFARENDEVYFVRIDRFSRSLKDLVLQMERCVEKGLKVYFDGVHYDFSTAQGQLYGAIFGAFAEFEKRLISARTKAGIEEKKRKGFKFGRPKGLSKLAESKAESAFRMRYEGATAEEICTKLEIKSPRTLYRYLRFHAEKIARETGRKLGKNGIDFI